MHYCMLKISYMGIIMYIHSVISCAKSMHGVQCTCSAEKLVLAVRCLNFPRLMVFIIIYVVSTVVTVKFIRI